ncbi:MAG: hypothetical protein NUV77_01300 [Thermoguttaceae bacterium]|jgi:hypothetical protein|nr:hypothetical protein [Thermoguttaceae bacterium]
MASMPCAEIAEKTPAPNAVPWIQHANGAEVGTDETSAARC